MSLELEVKLTDHLDNMTIEMDNLREQYTAFLRKARGIAGASRRGKTMSDSRLQHYVDCAGRAVDNLSLLKIVRFDSDTAIVPATALIEDDSIEEYSDVYLGDTDEEDSADLRDRRRREGHL